MSQDKKEKLLWIGDSPHHSSDFGRITRELCAHLHKKFDLKVLGLYNSSYLDLGYPVIDALEAGTGDLGMQKAVHIINSWKPDYVVILNGPLMVGQYSSLIHQNCTHRIKVFTEKEKKENPNLPDSVVERIQETKVIGLITLSHRIYRTDLVDILNNTLDQAIVPTQFAVNELTKNGFQKPIAKIRFGVNPDNFPLKPKKESRGILGISEKAFVIYSGYRNQPEKRIDILLKGFVNFLKKHPNQEIILMMNCGVLDSGWDIPRLYQTLAKEAGITDWDLHLKLTVAQNEHPDFDDSTLALFYSAADIGVCTSHGEAWGFPTLQSAALGAPQIVPNFAALGELFNRGGIRINPSDSYIEPLSTSLAMGEGQVIRANDLSQGFEIYYTNQNQLKKDSLEAKSLAKELSWKTSAEAFEAQIKKN